MSVLLRLLGEGMACTGTRLWANNTWVTSVAGLMGSLRG